MKISSVYCITFAFFFTHSAYSGDNLDAFPTDVQYYTIQIKSVPYDDRDQAYDLGRVLREKNYPVYYRVKRINRQLFVRVRVGAFNSVSTADSFAEILKSKEGFEYFIDNLDVFVDTYKDRFFIFTTPQSIFYWNGEKTIELYDEPPLDNARISPDGKDIVFSIPHKIIKVNIDSKDVSILREDVKTPDELVRPEACWSPDGMYIAFLMYNEWEMKTELWVMDRDGSSARCLIPYDASKQYSVKSYLWSPVENKIFYVFGAAYGTSSVGGDIYQTDLEGNIRPVAIADRKDRAEVYRNFRIAGDTLYYKVVHYLDDQYMNREFLLRKISINDF
jgi:hypothetical protein